MKVNWPIVGLILGCVAIAAVIVVLWLTSNAMSEVG
jgi:hypothetical protein